MPIATLTFDLSDPDEQQEHLFALKGKDSRLSISELDEKLRRILKYPVEAKMMSEVSSWTNERFFGFGGVYMKLSKTEIFLRSIETQSKHLSKFTL